MMVNPHTERKISWRTESRLPLTHWVAKLYSVVPCSVYSAPAKHAQKGKELLPPKHLSNSTQEYLRYLTQYREGLVTYAVDAYEARQ